MKRLFQGFGAVLYKEFIVMFRDPTTLFFMFIPPLLQIVAFGFALDMDVRNLRMVVLDEDRTRESRRFLEAFENTGTYRVVAEVRSVEELSAAIRQGRACVGLQIPPDFARRLRAGRPAQAQVLIDGSNSATAQQALNTALQVAFRDSALRVLAAQGSAVLPIEVRPQMLYNPDMKSPNFYLPGVIGIALQIATVFATAMSVVRERERGTIETLLVSPVSRWGMMLGKIVPYLGVSLAMAFSLFLVLRWVFLVRIQGSLLFLAAASVLYIFALLSLGLAISTRAQNQMQALQMSVSIMLPTIFFSGFIFPRDTMPLVFYGISTVLPATYYIELMRAVILRGATFADIGHYLGILAAMGAVLFSLAALRFQRRLA
jgi:ABC-2 type transport system permease protein